MITNQTTPNGFKYIEIENKSCIAKVALQGGHLFHYQRYDEKPLLWLSQKSFFEPAKAIRGGIPICWPWFGKHPSDSSLPQHGFARTSLFELLEVKEPDEHTTEILLQLLSTPESLTLWPYQFKVALRIIIGPKLTVALTTINCDTGSFSISSALHSYFAVSDIHNVSVQGLHAKRYWDALTGEHKIQQGDVHIREEVDRVYQGTLNPLTLHDDDRTIHIHAKGSSSTVVWNPWIDKALQMADMENNAHKTMLCIETANARDDTKNLASGEEHTLQVVLS